MISNKFNESVDFLVYAPFEKASLSETFSENTFQQIQDQNDKQLKIFQLRCNASVNCLLISEAKLNCLSSKILFHILCANDFKTDICPRYLKHKSNY